MTIVKRTTCLICDNSGLVPYLSLGETALANSYLAEEDLKKPEFKAPLEVYFCENCHLAQLSHIVDRELLFRDYAYFTSTSPTTKEHFNSYAEEVMARFPELARQLTFEIASNDGILLQSFSEMGAKVLGIDPARNVAEFAIQKGVETIPEFFTSASVPNLIKKYGKAGIILANNVLAHTDVLNDVISGVKQFLDNCGVFVFEVQYLLDLIQKNEFDNTYHEHICYFSLRPLVHLIQKNGMDIFNVKHVDTQGGSLRVYASHAPLVYERDPSVDYYLNLEKSASLDKEETYLKFAKHPPVVKQSLKKLLQELKAMGKKVVGYGAPAKGNTLLQYAGITNNEISYITDNAPSKQNKYTPGTHIPIVSPSKLKEDVPDYILILAWNYAPSILEREKWFSLKGGKFIIPIPEPKII